MERQPEAKGNADQEGDQDLHRYVSYALRRRGRGSHEGYTACAATASGRARSPSGPAVCAHWSAPRFIAHSGSLAWGALRPILRRTPKAERRVGRPGVVVVQTSCQAARAPKRAKLTLLSSRTWRAGRPTGGEPCCRTGDPRPPVNPRAVEPRRNGLPLGVLRTLHPHHWEWSGPPGLRSPQTREEGRGRSVVPCVGVAELGPDLALLSMR